MALKTKIGPYRVPRKLSLGAGARGELVRRYKRYLRATPYHPEISDPDESVRRVVLRTDVRGESSGVRRFGEDLDDD